MRQIKQYGWVFYLADEINIDKNKCGKWMYFFNDINFASKICEEAVKSNIVVESKHTDSDNGVACFYLNADDFEAHKKTIKFFLDNKLIRRTNNGKLYNISFKLDNQTRSGDYGNSFHAEIKLSDYINLTNEEWIR